MRETVAELAERLRDAADVQERLLLLMAEQRPAIVAGHHNVVDAVAVRIEAEIARMAAVEGARAVAAEALADELGIAATRWSALREGLTPLEREALEPLVERLEALVRDLELANAINGQLVRHELELLDLSVRSLAAPDVRTTARAYTAAGSRAAAPVAGPLLLNTAA